jgi:DNA polymerase-3 subunit gamma/tau
VKQKYLHGRGFLNDLEKKSPASASNLEQGNILHPIQYNPDFLKIELGFGYSGQVFLDYLNEVEVYQKVINHLSHYFEIDSKKINLEMKQVSSEIDFVSQADIRENQAKLTNDDKIEEFKNNPLLKEAEKIFNAKVDKVILENKK